MERDKANYNGYKSSFEYYRWCEFARAFKQGDFSSLP